MAELPPASTEEVRVRWTNFADYYGKHFQRMTSQVYFAVMNALDVESLPNGGTILETACGGGEGLLMLSRHAPNARIFAIDLSSRMVEITQEALRNAPNVVEIKEGDNEHLPFPDRLSMMIDD